MTLHMVSCILDGAINYETDFQLGLDATKPVFGVSDKASLKQVSSAQRLARKLEFRL